MSTNKFTTNNNHTLVAVSNSDGETPVYLYAEPVGHSLIISGTVTANIGTLNGIATSAKQDTGNASLASIDTTLSTPSSILNGRTTVATAGTRTTLSASAACKSVTIKALTTNSGIIYVGNTTVASSNGFLLHAGDSISLDIGNLNTVNIDSSISGEGVTYLGVA